MHDLLHPLFSSSESAAASNLVFRFGVEVYNRFSNLFIEDLNKDNIEEHIPI